MKGIVLAAGKGTRLYPLTKSFSKHFLPIFDKPMIYYPLSVLLLVGIKDILIICNPSEVELFELLLGDGSKIGVKIEYKIQERPNGIAEAFLIGEEFIGNEDVCLILGDNVFYGQDLTSILMKGSKVSNGAVIFGYHVNNPEDFGVIEFDTNYDVISLEEKPKYPKSNYVVPGLYFYPNTVVSIAKSINRSQRGELEITSVNEKFLSDGNLKAILLGRGMAWLDTGTPESLINASNFVEIIQKRQGFYIGCIEEIAWRKSYINDEQLEDIANTYLSTKYGQYLKKLIK